jgi:hypothetical protein
MLIEYKVRFAKDGVTITQIVEPDGGSGSGPGGSGNGSGIGPGGGGNGSGIGPGGSGNGSSISPGGSGNGSGIGPGGSGNGSGIGPGGSAFVSGTGRIVVLGPLVIDAPCMTSAPYTGQPLVLKHFHLQKQQMLNWCWAAVAVSVQRFFDPESSMRQCDMVQTLNPDVKDCCGNPIPAPCNKVGLLQDALTKVACLQKVIRGPLSFSQIQEQMSAGLPVCVRIGWNGGSEVSGHFVVINGWGLSPTDVPLVHVLDPYFSNGVWPYAALISAGYQQGNGQWTDTFLVKQ